jgi:hypothetical protein
MSKPKKRYILVIFICLIFVSLIYLQARSDYAQTEQTEEEEQQQSLNMPEEKIIRVVLDKVNDILRLHPR